MAPVNLHRQHGFLNGRARKSRLQKRSDWTFKALADGSWVWRAAHPDGSTACSTQRFVTRKECVADATLHGYVAWIPEMERRRCARSS
jgi:hypothetical protein